MTEATELLPCPFCGERDITFNAVFPGYDGAFASCPNCDTNSGRYKSEADAVAAWNARALLPALITVREAFKDGISDAVMTCRWPECQCQNVHGVPWCQAVKIHDEVARQRDEALSKIAALGQEFDAADTKER